MTELFQYKLGQVCSRLSSGKGIPAKKVHEIGKYPVYGGNGLRGFTDHSNFNGECAVIGRQGAFCGNVRYFSGAAYMTEHAVVLCANEKNNTRYLAYLLSIMNLGRLSGQSAQPGLSVKTLAKQIVSVPSLAEQKVVVDTLSALDEKIENNSKINHHLEQMAQAIFKSWFMDCDPFGGGQPPQWRKGMLGDYVVIRRGGSPRPIQDFLSDSGLRWLKISDVTDLQTPYVLQIKEHIKESGLRKTVFQQSGALVLSNSATPGIPKILGVDTCIHDGWLYFPTSHFSIEYLYLFFKHIRQDLVALGNGSVFTNLKTDILKSFPVIAPDNATLQRFDETVKPLFKEMENCTRESAHIGDLRDSLLPRLMSGELSVVDIDAK